MLLHVSVILYTGVVLYFLWDQNQTPHPGTRPHRIEHGTRQEVTSYHLYKARHAHKRLCMVLPNYSKIQVLPGITSCRLVKDNKQAIELNSLLINNMPEG